MPFETRYFSFDDITPAQAWGLLDWCARHGASEFTVSALVTGKESERMRLFFASLDPYHLPPAPRRQLAAPAGGQFVRDVDRWRLTDTALRILRDALPMSFASSEFDEDLWLEDLAVHRDGEFMMGVLSHERGGVLRVTELELSELRATGFPDRDRVAWVGF